MELEIKKLKKRVADLEKKIKERSDSVFIGKAKKSIILINCCEYCCREEDCGND